MICQLMLFTQIKKKNFSELDGSSYATLREKAV